MNRDRWRRLATPCDGLATGRVATMKVLVRAGFRWPMPPVGDAMPSEWRRQGASPGPPIPGNECLTNPKIQVLNLTKEEVFAQVRALSEVEGMGMRRCVATGWPGIPAKPPLTSTNSPRDGLTARVATASHGVAWRRQASPPRRHTSTTPKETPMTRRHVEGRRNSDARFRTQNPIPADKKATERELGVDTAGLDEQLGIKRVRSRRRDELTAELIDAEERRPRG